MVSKKFRQITAKEILKKGMTFEYSVWTNKMPELF